MNSRIGEVNAGFAGFDGSYEIFCECGGGTCMERFPVTASAYAAVCAASGEYLAVPQHAPSAEAEDVDTDQGYVVVRATRALRPYAPISTLDLSPDAV